MLTLQRLAPAVATGQRRRRLGVFGHRCTVQLMPERDRLETRRLDITAQRQPDCAGLATCGAATRCQAWWLGIWTRVGLIAGAQWLEASCLAQLVCGLREILLQDGAIGDEHSNRTDSIGVDRIALEPLPYLTTERALHQALGTPQVANPFAELLEHLALVQREVTRPLGPKHSASLRDDEWVECLCCIG